MNIFRNYKVECQNRDRGVRVIAYKADSPEPFYQIQARRQGFLGIKYWHTYCQTPCYSDAVYVYDYMVTLRTPIKER